MNATSNTRASVLAKGTWPSNVVSVLLSILLAVTLFPATALSQPAASAPQSPTGDVVMEGVTVTQLLDAQASASEDPAALVTVRAGEASADATFAGGALAAQEVIAQSTPALAEALGSADGAASAADFRPDVTLAEGADETVAQAVTSSAYEGAQLYRADSAAPVMGSDGQAVQVLAAATIDGSVLYAVRGSDAVMKLPVGSRIELGYEAPAADEVEETPEGGSASEEVGGAEPADGENAPVADDPASGDSATDESATEGSTADGSTPTDEVATTDEPTDEGTQEDGVEGEGPAPDDSAGEGAQPESTPDENAGITDDPAEQGPAGDVVDSDQPTSPEGNRETDLTIDDLAAAGGTVSATVQAGDESAPAKVEGGLLASEAAVRDIVPSFAESHPAEGEPTALDYVFEPSVSLDWFGFFAPRNLSSSVDMGFYTGSYVRSANTLTPALAVANIDGMEYWADDEGNVRTLGTEEELLLNYASMAENTAPTASSAPAVLADTSVEYESITRESEVIFKQWKEGIEKDRPFDFAGGEISVNTVPNKQAEIDAGRLDDNNPYFGNTPDVPEHFEGAYVVEKNDERVRYQIDYLQKVKGKDEYVVHLATSGTEGPVVVTTTFTKQTHFVTFRYSEQSAERHSLTYETMIGDSAWASQGVSKPILVINPSTASETDEVTVEAVRDPGTQVYLHFHNVGFDQTSQNAYFVSDSNGSWVARSNNEAFGYTGVTNSSDSTRVTWKLRGISRDMTIHVVSGKPQGSITATFVSTSGAMSTSTNGGGKHGLERGVENGSGSWGGIDSNLNIPADDKSFAPNVTGAGAGAGPSERYTAEVTYTPTSPTTDWIAFRGAFNKVTGKHDGDNNAIEYLGSITIAHTPIGSSTSVTESVTFPPSSTDASYPEVETTLTQGDMKGVVVSVQRVNSASADVQNPGSGVGANKYDIKVTGAPVDFTVTANWVPTTGWSKTGFLSASYGSGFSNVQIDYGPFDGNSQELSSGGRQYVTDGYWAGTWVSPKSIYASDLWPGAGSGTNSNYAWVRVTFTLKSGYSMPQAVFQHSAGQWILSANADGTFGGTATYVGTNGADREVTGTGLQFYGMRNDKYPVKPTYDGQPNNVILENVTRIPENAPENDLWKVNLTRTGVNGDGSTTWRVAFPIYKARANTLLLSASQFTYPVSTSTAPVSDDSQYTLNGTVTWKSGTVPSYEGMDLSAENKTVTINNEVPISPMKQAGDDALWYFKGYRVKNSGDDLYQPGDTINLDTLAGKSTNFGNTSQIVLETVWHRGESEGQSVGAEYTAKYRNRNAGSDTTTKSYTEEVNVAMLAPGLAWSITPDETVERTVNGELTTFKRVKSEGMTSGDSFSLDEYSKPGNPAVFTYEHPQTISFDADSADPEGTGSGNDKLTEFGTITGQAPGSVSGYSYDQVLLTPTGVYADADLIGAYTNSTTLAGDARLNFQLETPGYMQVGWRGKTSNSLFTFDKDLNGDGFNDAVLINREWNDMTLEPMWQRVYVLFDLTANGGQDIAWTGKDSGAVYEYPLSVTDNSIGTVPTNGNLDGEKAVSSQSGSQNVANRVLNVQNGSDGSSAKNYVTGWSTSSGTGGDPVTDNMKIKNGKLYAEDGTTEIAALAVDKDTLRATVYAQYGDRSFAASLGKGEQTDTAPTASTNGDADYALTVNAVPGQESTADFTINLSALVPEYDGPNGQSTLMEPRLRNLSASSVQGAAATVSIADTPANNFGNAITSQGYTLSADSETDSMTSAPVKVTLPANAGEGTHTTRVTMVVDAGRYQLGWNYSKTITADVTFNVAYAEHDLAFEGIDYEAETIKFHSEQGLALNAQSLRFTSPNEMTSAPLALADNDTAVTAPLTDALDAWGAGDDAVPVNLHMDANGAYAAKDVDASVPRRPATPDVTASDAVGTADGAGQGAITINNYDNGYTYEIRTKTNGVWGEWEDATVTSDASGGAKGTIEVSAGTHQLRVKAKGDTEGAVDTPNFRSKETGEIVIGQVQPVTIKHVTVGGTDVKSIVEKALSGEDFANAVTDDTTIETGELLTSITDTWNKLAGESITHDGRTFRLQKAVQSQGEGEEYTFTSANDKTHAVTAPTTVTYYWVRTNVTINLDYGDGTSWVDGNTTITSLSMPVDDYLNNQGTVPTLPIPTKGDETQDFYREGEKFLGWFDAEEGGNQVMSGQLSGTDSSSVFNSPSADASEVTLHAQWADASYAVAPSQSVAQTKSYGEEPDEMTADVQFNGADVSTARVLKVSLEGAGASNFALVGAGGQKLLVGGSEIMFAHPVTVADGFEIVVSPQSDLGEGTYTVNAKIAYDGGAGAGLDMGDNVKESSADVTFTFTVTKADLDVEFGEVNWSEEWVSIVGADAPDTVDAAVASATDASPELKIEGVPQSYLQRESSWEVVNDTLRLKLTDLLDTEVGDTEAGDAWANEATDWTTPGTEIELGLTYAKANHNQATDSVKVHSREAAPKLHDSADTRALGEGKNATVRMADLTDGQAGRHYEHMHPTCSGLQSEGTWLDLNHEVGTELSLSDPAIDQPYLVTLAPQAPTAQDGAGYFRSKSLEFKISQWYKVTYQLVHEDGSAVSDDEVGIVQDDNTVKFNQNFDGTVNDPYRGVENYRTEQNPTTAVDSIYVPKGGTYKLPTFGGVKGNWETPGYDIVKIAASRAFDGGTATADDIVSVETGNVQPGGRPEQSAYDKTASSEITGDTVITATLRERVIRVLWAVDYNNPNEKNSFNKHTYTGTGDGDGNGQAVTTQYVPWTQQVRTSLLMDITGKTEYWNVEDTDWLSTWFGEGYAGVPVDPVKVSWSGLFRDPWQIKEPDATSYPSQWHSFQVAESISARATSNPRTLFSSSDNGVTRAANWRNATTITFGVVYQPSTGVYGVQFTVPKGYGVTNGNGASSRLSEANSSGVVDSTVKLNGVDSDTLDAPGIFKGDNIVFSGFYFVNGGGLNTEYGLENPTYRWEARPTTVEENLTAAYGEYNNLESGELRNTDRPKPHNRAVTGDASKLPDESKFELQARVENARLTSTNTVPLVTTTDNAQGKKTLTISPEDLFVLKDGDPGYGKEQADAVKFEITKVEVTGANTSWIDGEGLSCADGSDSVIENVGESAEYSIPVKSGLANGTYNATLKVAYAYTPSTSTQDTNPKYENLTYEIPLTMTVRDSVEGADVIGSARDFATWKDQVSKELGSNEAILDAIDFGVYRTDDAGVMAELTKDVDYNVTSVSVEGVEQFDEDTPAGSYLVTVTWAPKDGEQQATTATISIYDKGAEKDGIRVVANDASTTLPEKDVRVDGRMGGNKNAFQMWVRDELAQAKAYNVNNDWSPVTLNVIDEGDALWNAGPDAVGKDSLNVAFSFGNTQLTTDVSLVKASYPGAPAWVNDVAQDLAKTTQDTAAWTAATRHESFDENGTVNKVAGLRGYAPGITYTVTDAGGTVVVPEYSDDLAIADRMANTRYTVTAEHSDDDVYENAPQDGSGASSATVWTLPAAPTNDNYEYDYANETARLSDAFGAEQGDGTVSVSTSLKNNSVANLAGVYGANGSKEASKGATQPGTFAATVTGDESALSATSTIDNLPWRAAKPNLTVENPDLASQGSVVTGFDVFYVNDGSTGASQYQISDDNGTTWFGGFDEQGNRKSDDTTLTLEQQSGAWQYTLPAGASGEYVFRVLYRAPSEGSGVNDANGTDDAGAANSEQGSSADCYFTSETSTPVTAASGARIDARDFTIGLNQIIDKSGALLTGNSLANVLRNGANVTIEPSGAAYTSHVSVNGLDEAKQGMYDVTFTLTKDGSGSDIAEGEGSSKTVKMTVVSQGAAGDPDSKLFANDFVVGLNQLEQLDKAGLDELAWRQSGASGVKKDGTTPLVGPVATDHGNSDVSISYNDGQINDPSQLEAGKSYKVHLHADESVSSKTDLHIDVTMTVFDNVAESMVDDATYLVASNDFTAGENELAERASLSVDAIIARANAQAFEYRSAAGTSAAIVKHDVVIAEGSKYIGAKAGDEAYALFGVKGVPSASTSCSDITVTGDGSGSDDAKWRISGYDFHAVRSDFSAGNVAQKLYQLAQVTGVSGGNPITENEHGSTWNVKVYPHNHADTDAEIGLDPAKWTADAYDVVFTLKNSSSPAYAANVTMNLHDNGETGVGEDGVRYAIFSDDFAMGDSEYITLFKGNSLTPELKERAHVEAYKIVNGVYEPYAHSDGTSPVIVDTSNFSQAECVAGATKENAVAFQLPQSGNNPIVSSSSDVTVYGDFDEDGNGNTLSAQHFYMRLSDLDGTPREIPPELSAAMKQQAQVSVEPADSNVAVESVEPATSAWEHGVYQVTFKAESLNLFATVDMHVYDNVAVDDATGYIIVANDFRVTEDEANSLTSEQLRERAGAQVFKKDAPGTPLELGQDFSVDATNLRGHAAGQESNVTFSYKTGATSSVSATSQVDVYANGSTGSADEGKLASIFASSINTTQAELDDNSENPDWFYEKAGVTGTGKDGAELGAYDSSKVGVSYDPAVSVVTFAVLGTNVSTTVPVTVYDTGGQVTDDNNTPDDPTDDIVYEIYSNNFDTTVEAAQAMADEGDPYRTLLAAAGVVATTRVPGKPAQAVSPDGIQTNPGRLGSVTTATTESVAFKHENVAGSPEATSVVTVYTSGESGEVDGGDSGQVKVEIYANDIFASKADLEANANNLNAWLFAMAGVVGTNVQGTELTVDHVVVSFDGTTDFTAETLQNGGVVTFAVKNGKGDASSVTAESQLTVFGNGDSTTVKPDPTNPDKPGEEVIPKDPTDPDDPANEDGNIRYSVFSDDFAVSLDEITNNVLTDAVLKARANAMATKRVLGGALSVLGSDDIAVFRDVLDSVTEPGGSSVSFLNTADDVSPAPTSESHVTVYASGETADDGAGGSVYVYANDGIASYGALTAEGADIGQIILDATKAFYGPESAGEPTVSVRVNGVWTPVENLESADLFDDWKSPEYEVRIELGSAAAEVLLTVSDQTATVSYETNGGEQIASDTVVKGEPVTLPAPSRSGYTFEGWYSDDGTFANRVGGAGDSYTPTSDVTLYAKWTEKENRPPAVTYVTLTYETNGGVDIPVVTVPKGTSVTLATPLREGWTFTGWYLDDALTMPVGMGGAKLVIKASTTVWAGWEKSPVSSNFTTSHVNYITGRPQEDGTSLAAPLANVTRAEVATMVYRLLDEDARAANSTTSDSFPDTDENAWYARPVATLAAMGAIHGYPDGTFGPDALITRAELTAIMVRLSDEYEDGQMYGDLPFTDVPSDHWAVSVISFAVNHGWLLGDDGIGKSFRPDASITRAETMAILNRLLNRLPYDEADLLDGRSTWPDNQDKTAWYWLTVEEATNNHAHAYVRGQHGVHEPEVDENGEPVAIDEHERWTALVPNVDWSE